MKSIFKNSIIIAALLFGAASVSNAQVKVGANPAAIGTNSNLEVEAANGNKTIVNKATGQVTIQDGTQGANKVLTSDANGVASWQNGIATPCSSVQARRASAQNVPLNPLSTDPFTTLIPDVEIYDPANAYNTTTGVYTVPTTGFYLFVGSAVDYISGASGSRNSTLIIYSSIQSILSQGVQQTVPYNNGTYQNLTALAYCTAGEQITFAIQVAHNPTSGTRPQTTIPVYNVRFAASRTDCGGN